MTRETSHGGIDVGSWGGQVLAMRGRSEEQTSMFMLMTLESRVAADHPLRRFKALADSALKELSPLFDEMYGETGRPSVPPERLLEATLGRPLTRSEASASSATTTSGATSAARSGRTRPTSRRPNPEAKLARKSNGKEAKRAYAGHAQVRTATG